MDMLKWISYFFLGLVVFNLGVFCFLLREAEAEAEEADEE